MFVIIKHSVHGESTETVVKFQYIIDGTPPFIVKIDNKGFVFKIFVGAKTFVSKVFIEKTDCENELHSLLNLINSLEVYFERLKASCEPVLKIFVVDKETGNKTERTFSSSDSLLFTIEI